MYRLIAVVRAANHGVLAGSIRGVANLDGGMMEGDRVFLLESLLGWFMLSCARDVPD